MPGKLQRRDFLAGSLAAVTATAVSQGSAMASNPKGQELCEVRFYRNTNPDKQKLTLRFVEEALCPALNRQGIERIGIFKPANKQDAAVCMVIPYATMDQLAGQNDHLEVDEAYHENAAPYFSLPKIAPPFRRIESRLTRTFAGMPSVVPPSRKSGDRIMELRIYQSHNEHLARRKVEMFNKGEIELMKNVGLGPVFFGETLVSHDVPNLTYLLSADSPEAHKEHWKAFLAHPEWDRMKNLKRYADTVSNIVSVMLIPTAASQL